MPRADHGTTLVIDKVQIKHSGYDDEDSSEGTNRCRITPRARKEMEGSKKRSKNRGKSKFSPTHMAPNVELTGAA